MLFTGGPSNDLVALNATTGEALWHSILNSSISNGPITYELDGRQYVVAAAGRYAVDVRDEYTAGQVGILG